MPLKLKKEAEDLVIGFNNSSEPLGKRKDLHLLYLSAHKKNYAPHLDLFEEEPTEKELEEMQEKTFNARKPNRKTIQTTSDKVSTNNQSDKSGA